MLSEKVLLLVLKSVPNNKSAGNNDLSKEFYKVLYQVSKSQKQAVIRLTAKNKERKIKDLFKIGDNIFIKCRFENYF